MNLRIPLLLLGLAAVAAGCSGYRSNTFFDGFDGTGFPARGWITTGPAAVLDTTSGNPAGSLTWTSCPGTNAVAEINENFASEGGLDVLFDFQVYGAALTTNTGVSLILEGNLGDAAQVVVQPAPSASVVFDLNGFAQQVPLPSADTWHTIEFNLDSLGDATWVMDSGIQEPLESNFASGNYVVAFGCAEGNLLPGPVPVLIDNVRVSSLGD